MRTVQHAFNRAALTYDANCKLQFRVAKELIKITQQHVTAANTILELGCGTGVTSAIAMTKLQHKNYFILDLAGNLLEIAKNRLSLANSGILANFDNLPIQANSINLCLANMSLHWSKGINQALANIYYCLAEHGVLAFSLPVEGTFYELSNAISHTNCTNFLNCFPSHSQLQHALKNYRVIYQETQTKTLHFSNIYTLLKSMKTIGSNRTHSTKLTSRSEFNKIDNYFHFKNHLPKIPLTYKIAFYLVSKK